jgi:sugar phosphate permease
MPVLAPGLRTVYGLTLPQVGLMLAALSAGGLATVFVWGLAADRFGERLTLVVGLVGMALCIVGLAYAPGFDALVVLAGLAAASGCSVNSASARAVMHWFPPDERGYALGLRQAAVPLGGLASAILLPPIEAAAGLKAALLTLAGICLLGALAGGYFVRENHAGKVGQRAPASPWSLRDPRIWRLGFACSFYVFTQVAMMGFVVLFLHDTRGFSIQTAAMVLAAIYVLGGILRIAGGRWSDRRGLRLVPLRYFGLATCLTGAILACLVDAPAIALVPVAVAAGGISMGWNGLAMTAAAELAGRERSGAAIGVQQTFLSVGAVVAPIAFAATVDAASWRIAFSLVALTALLGWWLLKPLSEKRRPATSERLGPAREPAKL